MGRSSQGFRAVSGYALQGADHHAKISLELEDSFSETVRQLSLQWPYDAGGHVVLTTRTLNVKIPKGVRAGQLSA